MPGGRESRLIGMLPNRATTKSSRPPDNAANPLANESLNRAPLSAAQLDKLALPTKHQRAYPPIVQKQDFANLDTSGIRVGTPAVTTRGLKEPEMVRVAALINRALEKPEDPAHLASVKAAVKELTQGFSIYRGLLDEVEAD